MMSVTNKHSDNILSRLNWYINIEQFKPSHPKFGDVITQIAFLGGLIGLVGVGNVIALPYIYDDENTIFKLRLLDCFITLQILVNWVCMKFLDTTYVPFRDGTIPDGVSVGQNISMSMSRETSCEKEDTTSRSRKDVSLPLYSGAHSNGNSTDLSPADEEEAEEKDGYPYLSWIPCVHCNRLKPPRAHHCPLCDKCILKRDHHCFFAGTCIGLRNLRHFTVFCFWAWVGTIITGLHALPFWYYDILPYTRVVDLFVPLAFVRALLGYIEWRFVICIALGWALVFFFLTANTYLKYAINSIVTGKTYYEIEKDIDVIDAREPPKRFEAVFGKFAMFNFIVPLHFLHQPIEDPLRWPSVIMKH